MTDAPRIALVHATPLAVEPVAEALARSWPQAEAVNILDDSLSPDRAKCEQITANLNERIMALATYARSLHAAGVLFTCSAFGNAIEAANAAGAEPVLKPNEAMFDAALNAGDTIAMLYTFAPAGRGMVEEFEVAAACENSKSQLTPHFVDGAIDALRRGDVDLHNQLVADAAAKLSGYDAILLAHFSTSRALEPARRSTSTPVFSAPDAAVLALRSKLEAQRSNLKTEGAT